MSFTVQELDEAVSLGWTHTYDDGSGYETEGWHALLEEIDCWRGDAPTFDLPGIGTVSLVEDHGGGEGSGEERWFVFKVVDEHGEERLFRRNGYYASFYGSDFDGPTEEVQPVQKMITVFEAVK